MRERLIELLKGAETKVTETLSTPLALEEWLGIYADYLLANGVIVTPCVAAGMKLKKAVKLLGEKYERAQKSEYVKKPLALALVQTLKEVESMEDEKMREYNRIAQQRSREKKKGGE